MKKLSIVIIALLMAFRAEPVQAASWVDMSKIFAQQTTSWMLTQLQNKISNVGATPFYYTAGFCVIAASLYLIKGYKENAKEEAQTRLSQSPRPPRHA
jgi:hypothetical protein